MTRPAFARLDVWIVGPINVSELSLTRDATLEVFLCLLSDWFFQWIGAAAERENEKERGGRQHSDHASRLKMRSFNARKSKSGREVGARYDLHSAIELRHWKFA